MLVWASLQVAQIPPSIALSRLLLLQIYEVSMLYYFSISILRYCCTTSAMSEPAKTASSFSARRDSSSSPCLWDGLRLDQGFKAFRI